MPPRYGATPPPGRMVIAKSSRRTCVLEARDFDCIRIGSSSVGYLEWVIDPRGRGRASASFREPPPGYGEVRATAAPRWPSSADRASRGIKPDQGVLRPDHCAKLMLIEDAAKGRLRRAGTAGGPTRSRPSARTKVKRGLPAAGSPHSVAAASALSRSGGR